MPEVFGELGSGGEFALAPLRGGYIDTAVFASCVRKKMVITAEWLLIQGVAEPGD